MAAQRAIRCLSAALCLAILMAGCDLSASGMAPAAASVRQEPSPAGATPSSSPLPTARTGNPAARDLSDALANTHGARTYRITLDITTAASSADKSTSDVFLSLDGVVLGASSHITYSKGSVNDLLGGGDLIEVINIEQRTYMRGSTLFGGSDPRAWYVLPDSEMTRIPFDAWYLLTLAGIDGRSARASGAESRDGMSCTVWTARFAANAIKLLELSAPQEATTDFSAIDRADARMLVCPDGFLHAMDFDVSAHIPDRPADHYSTAIRLRLFDFNARTLIVAAPSGAIEVK